MTTKGSPGAWSLTDDDRTVPAANRPQGASTGKPPLIVHIIYALGTGGLENGLVNILNRCPPERYRHAIICLTSAAHFANRLTALNVEVIELHKRPGHDLAMYWRLWRQLRRLRPAIVHTRNLAALETQWLGLLLPGCKRVHGEHGRDMHDLDGSNRKYQWLRRALSPLIHRFIAVSQDLSQWLIDIVHIPKAKVSRIYNGVDKQLFRQGPNESCPTPARMPEGFRACDNTVVLGTVGRLVAVKDQQLLLVTLHRLIRERPELSTKLRLVIVGAGPEYAALCALRDKLALTDRVWLAGEREDIPELLRTLDIFVLPSLGEGISNTLLEAMATGLPVIATAVGGNPELVTDGKTGLLFPVGDVNALVVAIATLVENPALRRDMGRAALAQTKQFFDWERTVASYLAVYDELLRTTGHLTQLAGR